MKVLAPASLLGLLAVSREFTNAILLPLHGEQRRRPDLSRRGNLVGGISSLNDSSDVQYSTVVNLNGQNFQCLIDTGSSDLWVAGTVSNAQSTGLTSGVQYAVGEVTGPIMTATMEFAGFTVQNQAFLQITPDSSNIEGSGLIGLGPSTGSNIRGAFASASGDPPLDQIFRQNKSTPNIITILLSRSDDPAEKFTGDMSVGEILPGFDAVTSQPKLAVSKVTVGNTANQHWSTLLDANGIIGPDGNTIPYKSAVSNTSDTSKATVIFDSGFSLPQVPSSVASAIYSGISGAKLENISSIGETWTLPCDQEVNLTFVFGGVKYPIHPLDTNMNGTDLALSYPDGSQLCIGAFQPVSFDSTFGTGEVLFDMIMGMGFLRNAYLLIDYGDFLDGSTSTADPYIQLLSTTNDSASAHQDFVKVRLNGNDTTTDILHKAVSAVKKVAIIAGAIAIGCAILLIGLCWCCFCRRRATTSAKAGGVMGFGGQTYRPLDEPAPGAATETYAMPNLYGQQPQPEHIPYQPPPGQPPYGGQYEAPYGAPPVGGPPQQYQTAWDHRA